MSREENSEPYPFFSGHACRPARSLTLTSSRAMALVPSHRHGHHPAFGGATFSFSDRSAQGGLGQLRAESARPRHQTCLGPSCFGVIGQRNKRNTGTRDRSLRQRADRCSQAAQDVCTWAEPHFRDGGQRSGHSFGFFGNDPGSRILADKLDLSAVAGAVSCG